MDLLTIGITCFNANKTISRAIDSAINQDWLNKEIIIVDDKSNDTSIYQINKYINHKNIKIIIHNKNLGPAGSTNTIINNANGKYIAFFDDDDVSYKNRISSQYKKIKLYEKKLNTDLVACYASGIRIYPNSYKMQLNSISSNNDLPLSGNLIPNYLLLNKLNNKYFYGSGIPSCAIMAKKSTFLKVNGYDEDFRRIEDADFAIRLSNIGGFFIGTKENLYLQYSTIGSDKSSFKNLESEQLIVKKHKYFFNNYRDYFHAYNWPLLRFYHFNKKYYKFTLLFLKLFCNKPIYSIIHLLISGPRRILHEIKMKKN